MIFLFKRHIIMQGGLYFHNAFSFCDTIYQFFALDLNILVR